jgi:hypothetical protein
MKWKTAFTAQFSTVWNTYRSGGNLDGFLASVSKLFDNQSASQSEMYNVAKQVLLKKPLVSQVSLQLDSVRAIRSTLCDPTAQKGVHVLLLAAESPDQAEPVHLTNVSATLQRFSLTCLSLQGFLQFIRSCCETNYRGSLT